MHQTKRLGCSCYGNNSLQYSFPRFLSKSCSEFCSRIKDIDLIQRARWGMSEALDTLIGLWLLSSELQTSVYQAILQISEIPISFKSDLLCSKEICDSREASTGLVPDFCPPSAGKQLVPPPQQCQEGTFLVTAPWGSNWEEHFPLPIVTAAWAFATGHTWIVTFFKTEDKNADREWNGTFMILSAMEDCTPCLKLLSIPTQLEMDFWWGGVCLKRTIFFL